MNLKSALSRRWLCRQLRARSGLGELGEFGLILLEFAPDHLRALANASVVDVYEDVVSVVSGLFPVNDVVIQGDVDELSQMMAEGLDFGEIIRRMQDFYIPLDLFGISQVDDSDDDVANALWVCGYGSDTVHHLLRVQTVLTPPWDGIGDMVAWASFCTDSHFLDNNWMDMEYQGGADFVTWSLGAIRWLAEDWKAAEERWDRINALRDFVANRPEHLQRLQDIIAGDTFMLAEVVHVG